MEYLRLLLKNLTMYEPITIVKDADVKQPTKEDHEKKVLRYKIDINEDIPKPQIAYSIQNKTDGKDVMLATLGNISMLIGKAKAGKSFAINIIISTLLNLHNTLQRFKNHLPSDKKKVLYFDT
jgi:putative ribosome biogenesis GTPase RsgA